MSSIPPDKPLGQDHTVSSSSSSSSSSTNETDATAEALNNVASYVFATSTDNEWQRAVVSNDDGGGSGGGGGDGGGDGFAIPLRRPRQVTAISLSTVVATVPLVNEFLGSSVARVNQIFNNAQESHNRSIITRIKELPFFIPIINQLSLDQPPLSQAQSLGIIAEYAKKHMSEEEYTGIQQESGGPISVLFFSRLHEQCQANKNDALVKLGLALGVPEIDTTQPIALQAQRVKAWLDNPQNHAQLAQVTELNLSMQNLKTVPEEIALLPNLRDLDLSFNQLQEVQLPPAMGQLEVINIGDNKLKNIVFPTETPNLNHLYLARNNLKELTIPPTAHNLSNLFLEENELLHLEISPNLSQLEYIQLSDKQLTTLTLLPEMLRLNTLNLSHNRLITLNLPTQMPSAAFLTFDNNELTNISLPAELPNILKLHLQGNPLANKEALATLSQDIEDFSI